MRPAFRFPPRACRGFTVMEIVVAMGIFIVLGAALITILRQGLALWRTGEAKKDAHEKANFILSYLREDLASTYSKVGGSMPIRFLCDLEPESEERGVQRQRLRFVRTRRGESQHPIGSQGGRVLESNQYFDHFGDVEEARSGYLRAGAGLQEVLYSLDPDPDSTTLWRGVRSPPGGAGSLMAPDWDSSWVEESCRELASGVLHLEFRFWTQYTSTWEEDDFPYPFPHDDERRSGPAFIWDSTRGLFPPEDDMPDDAFRMYRGPDSMGDSSDDIFPRQVLVILVMETPIQVTLSSGISAETSRIPIRGAAKLPGDGPGYVRIDREWIRYVKVEKGRLVLESSFRGRGARWTRAVSHKKGTDVRVGRTFRMTVRIAASRDHWDEGVLNRGH